MKHKNLIKIITATTIATTTISVCPPVFENTVLADTTQNSNSQTQHTLQAAYVVYGSGVANDVYPSLNNVLQTDSSFKKLTATADDYRQYINSASNTTNAAMISSVAIAPGDPGSGVKVNIKNYNGENNITKVTSQQYAMVAQMAGVTDVSIVVTANRAVSGESALTGVYKALAQDGAQINTDNTAAANTMLDATQSAIDANKDDANYPGKLMAAVGDVSKQIAQQKQDDQNELATKADIQAMLEKALQQRGIASQTTNNQIIQIVNALVKFQDSPISSNKSYINSVDDTINNVKNSSGNLMNKAKNWANSANFNQTTEQAQNWFTKFINWIKSLFTSNNTQSTPDSINEQSSINE
ncbi:hypothetical protein FC40_GL001344 [Ligilactobacillus hayakitensis DSM 18933 = JCM 14209]|uniref:DUF1002 domain-containing protein n=1 Tax=Ligilactobacillus hayakitensis DSM 18933 = JCM 14209 TaxID=1423755 RepID=A0A0R1WZY2_9LACO|nr:DUF1002 domain-containing protein [Ligilactobacillus hayakitensis]KRM19740.1 hypothetical protein FC40_GL001344 [Ligilactobacillus hayakitensis DSM 18933 = JCM 14209]